VPRERQNSRLVAELTSPEHAPAVLRWLVDGCVEWQASGLGSAARVAKASAAYKANMNPLHDFAAECLVFDESAKCEVAVLANIYTAWASTNRVKFPLRTAPFKRALEALGARPGEWLGKKRAWGGVGLQPHVLAENPGWGFGGL
jgi:putative DNA primase/helicase